MVARMVQLLTLSGVMVLAGCSAQHGVVKTSVSRPPVTLLAGLSQQVGALKAKASAGDRQAEEALLAMISGQGVKVLMAQRTDATDSASR